MRAKNSQLGAQKRVVSPSFLASMAEVGLQGLQGFVVGLFCLHTRSLLTLMHTSGWSAGICEPCSASPACIPGAIVASGRGGGVVVGGGEGEDAVQMEDETFCRRRRRREKEEEAKMQILLPSNRWWMPPN